METVAIVYAVVLAIQSVFLVWFGTMVFTQKSIIKSFKAQSGGVRDLQELQLNLIKPETINNIVQLKVEEEQQNMKREANILDEEHTELLTILTLIFGLYPNESDIQYLRKTFKDNLKIIIDRAVPMANARIDEIRKK